ncbi:hypothetical protein COO60DRAFT_1637521 [Scenedesmus sp. NREL 46B-D3]|nr:hypothetical protein COO60DRAFT_1637521 [Scenedesmus sp. NREL 46B-D3]
MQVVLYAQLERVLPAGSTGHQQHMQPTPPPAADGLQAPQQQQQPQQLDTAVPLQPELDAEEDEAAVSLKPAAADPGHAAGAAADAAGADQAEAQQQQQQKQHVHQYSIVYHDTYRVPVLYLKACKPDGQPLSLAQLLQDLPALQQYKEASQADWTFITQVNSMASSEDCVAAGLWAADERRSGVLPQLGR